MKKTVIAAAAAMLIAGSAIAQAANPAPPAEAAQAGNRDGGRAERHAFPEAKLNKLKDSLKLTEDQQKLWPAFETALREVSQERTARWTEFRAKRQAMRQGEAQQRPDTVTHLRNAADHMSTLAGEMNKVADALTPLYQSFDATQKQKFDETVRQDLRGFFGMMSPSKRGERPSRS